MSADGLLICEPEPETGKTHTFRELGNDRYAIETRLDVEPMLDHAQTIRVHCWDGKYRDGTLAAILPMPIWHQLRREGILQDPKALQRWINEHWKLKATEGNCISLLNP